MSSFEEALAARRAAEGRSSSPDAGPAQVPPATWRGAQYGPQMLRAPAELTGYVNTNTLAGLERLSNPFSGFYTKPAQNMDQAVNEFYEIYYGGSPAVRSALDQIAKRQRSTPKGIWEDMVYLSDMRSGEGVFMTPLDILYETYLGFELTSSSSGSSGGGGYGGGYSTQQTIDLTSPTQARGLLMQTIQGALGRNPTEDEYSQFLTILNESQTANPQVVSAAGDTVTRSGGVDPGVLALDYAQSRDDYEDVQANQYYNMFLDVLAGG